MKSPNGAIWEPFGAVTAPDGANLSMARNVTSRESACCAIRISSIELDARKHNGPCADLLCDRRSDSEESASFRSDGGPINVETALTKIVVGWVEAARLGSSRSVSCGSKANILASATGGNRAPWIIHPEILHEAGCPAEVFGIPVLLGILVSKSPTFCLVDHYS